MPKITSDIVVIQDGKHIKDQSIETIWFLTRGYIMVINGQVYFTIYE